MSADVTCFMGMKVRVRQEHRIPGRRGMVGNVVGRYGGEEYVAIDVRFPNGHHRLFWPSDLEEISPPLLSLWRPLVGAENRG